MRKIFTYDGVVRGLLTVALAGAAWCGAAQTGAGWFRHGTFIEAFAFVDHTDAQRSSSGIAGVYEPADGVINLSITGSEAENVFDVGPHDAAGRLLRQTDNKGNKTVNKYDEQGRLDYSTLNGVKTDYEYGIRDKELDLLTRIETGNTAITYEHDGLGRTIRETRFLDGEQLEFGFVYDSKGAMEAEVYPGGVAKRLYYDPYGNHIRSAVNNQTVWELTGETGLQTTTRLGDRLTQTTTHNEKGLLTGIKTALGNTSILDMNFTFDAATGHLDERSGMITKWK